MHFILNQVKERKCSYQNSNKRIIKGLYQRTIPNQNQIKANNHNKTAMNSCIYQ